MNLRDKPTIKNSKVIRKVLKDEKLVIVDEKLKNFE